MNLEQRSLSAEASPELTILNFHPTRAHVLFQWIILSTSTAHWSLSAAHAIFWQLFTEKSWIYRYLVFGMKFIEFISVVQAIYLVVIFVIAGCR